MAQEVSQIAGKLLPHQIRPIAFDALLAHWRDRYAAHTLYNLSHQLRRFLATLAAEGAPAIRLPKVRPGRPKQSVATATDQAKLLNAAPPHMRLFLLLIGQLGLRFSEAVHLAPKDWNQDAGTITFTKKGGDQHTLPTTPEIEHLFSLAKGDQHQPFIAQLKGPRGTHHGSITHWAIRAEFYRLVKKAQVNPALTPHDFRRAVAVSLYDLTKDIRAVSQLLGHQRLATTAGYIEHRDHDKLRSLLAELRMPTETKQ